MVETFYSALHWAKKAEKSAKLASELSQSTGKVIQLGFDGSFENGELVFKHAPGGVELPYDLYDDTEYEIDLAFSQTGELPNLTKMYVKNGNDKIVFVSAQHRSSTENARVTDMEDVMRYNESTGYRWLFKATYKITPSGNKVFLIYPVIAKKDTSIITNCITEIPQDIKLELNDGVLTLKAGSRVYVPNGFEADGTTPKFDIEIVESDIIEPVEQTYTNTCFFFYRNGKLSFELIGQSFSGTTAPTSYAYMSWYDTTNNVVKKTSSTGSSWTSGYSLPIAIVSQTSGIGWTSIDQVFNGFGYIGSTVFALPGVKGLIPNGRNADGSLKNIEFVIDNVLTRTNPVAISGNFRITLKRTNLLEIVYYAYSYDADRNINYNNLHGDTFLYMDAGNYNQDSTGKIISFNPKTTFQVVDRSDSSWLAERAMPSNKYIDLTFGAYGTEYIAPANGWFDTEGVGAANTSNWIECDVLDGGVLIYHNGRYAQTSNNMRLLTPVAKGKKYVLRYSSAVGLTLNRFIYAEGEK